MKNSSRTIMAVIAALVGLFFVFINPGLVDDTVNKLLMGMTDAGTSPMKSVPALRMFLSSTWRGLVVVAGVVLIVSAYALYLGKKWAFPLSLVCLSIAPIGSFYIGLLYMVKTGSFPPAWIAFVLGLLAFWAMLLLEENESKLKIALFVSLTLLGMIGTQAFAFAEHGLRGILPDLTSSVTDSTVGVLRYSGPIMGMIVVLLLITIWLLAARKEAGWWLGLVVGLSMAIGAYPVHFARPKASMALPGSTDPSIFTSTYFLGGTLGIILVVVLLIPFFKNQLMLNPEAESAE